MSDICSGPWAAVFSAEDFLREHVSPHAIPCLHHNTVTKVSFENILCMSTLVERKINVDNVDEGARKPVEKCLKVPFWLRGQVMLFLLFRILLMLLFSLLSYNILY